MKKTLKTISVLVMAVLFSVNVTAFAADASIVCKGSGSSEPFVTLPGDDLFGGFKNVMPGDVRTEEITIKNKFSGSDEVYIYMQAVSHNANNPLSPEVAAKEDLDSMKDFLHQMTLTVTQDGKVLSQDTAEKPAGLAESTLVGHFKGKGSSEIQVTLSVPIEMGNEYADRIGEVDWVFYASEINHPPVTPDTPDTPNTPNNPHSPKTGDTTGTAFYTLLMLFCAASVVVLIKKRKS